MTFSDVQAVQSPSGLIPYGRHQIADEDIEAVVKALQSDRITGGARVEQFESAFANYVGARHAVAVSSGTAALHLAMRVADIGPGHRVITTPNTFLASANCAAYVGAVPDFVDIDPVSYNLCPQKLAEDWRPDTAAVVAVHYGGGAADMRAIYEHARAQGAVVVEDACHAVGGKIEVAGQVFSIGGHPWADITTFSFHPVKTMTTGEGGMLVTDNEDFARRARLLRSHAMTRDPSDFLGLGLNSGEQHGPWHYEMQELGYNYRITDLQAALGLSQLARLDEMTARRRKIVSLYNEAFSSLSNISTPELKNTRESELTSWHLYSLQIDFAGLGLTRAGVMQRLRERNIGTQVLYIPVYLQPYYQQNYGYRPGKCRNAESFYQRALSLPLFPALSDDELDYVIQQVLALLGPA